MSPKKLILLTALLASLILLALVINRSENINLPNNYVNYFQIKSKRQTYQIILVGDIMLGRTVMTESLSQNNPTYPFDKTYQVLREGDLVFANLESPFVSSCPPKSDGLIFCSDPKLVQGLVYSGIDIVTLANNHILNYGQKGLDETKILLAENNIESVGLNNLVIKKLGNTKFGFLGFNFVDQKPTSSDFELVKNSKPQVDVLIIGVHWGSEYTERPSDTQRQIAKDLINSGADIISGHHPHWIQEVANINGKIVYYSLGNFVFDQMWSQKTREGLVVRLTFDEKGSIKKEELLKTYINSWAQPEFVN